MDTQTECFLFEVSPANTKFSQSTPLESSMRIPLRTLIFRTLVLMLLHCISATGYKQKENELTLSKYSVLFIL